MKSFGVTSFGPWCETRSFALISDVADGIFLLTIKRGWRRQLFLCRKWQSDEPGVIWKVQLPLGRYLVWRRLFSDIVPTASAPEELEDYLTTARHIDEKTGKVTWVKFVTNVVPRPAPARRSRRRCRSSVGPGAIER